MIDLHCHLLPGVDDGARNMSAALDLARASVQNGITAAVLTPHVYWGRWDNTRSSLQAPFEQFRHELELAGIDLDVRLGGEVHLLSESLDLFDHGDMPFIGGWNGQRVVLLELPDGHIPKGAFTAAEYFLERQVIPMIAHPERNKDVMRNPRNFEPFIRMGCLMQLTAASVCGWFGANALKAANALLETGMVTIVATDAHNLRSRPPVLAEARSVLNQRFGPNAGPVLTEINPGAIFAARETLGLDVEGARLPAG